MANRAQHKKANRRKAVKYPNLRKAAANMGYNFTYLWRVLEGEFKGRPGLKEEFWAESARIEKERFGVQAEVQHERA